MQTTQTTTSTMNPVPSITAAIASAINHAYVYTQTRHWLLVCRYLCHTTNTSREYREQKFADTARRFGEVGGFVRLPMRQSVAIQLVPAISKVGGDASRGSHGVVAPTGTWVGHTARCRRPRRPPARRTQCPASPPPLRQLAMIHSTHSPASRLQISLSYNKHVTRIIIGSSIFTCIGALGTPSRTGPIRS